MIEIGRMCVKLAGRDARKKGIIIDVLDEGYVLIDGEIRRRKCNIKHLELLDKVIEIKKNADHGAVVEALEKEGISVPLKRKKSPGPRPRKVRKVKEKPEELPKKTAKPKKEIKPVKTEEEPKDKPAEKVEVKPEVKGPKKIKVEKNEDNPKGQVKEGV